MAREIILQKLPVGWSYNLLDNIAERCSGHTPSKSFPEYWNGGIKWISLADSCRLDKGYVYETDKEISLEGIKNSSAEVHPAETVVLSRDAGVGKSGVMATPMAVSQHFIAWKCDNKEKLHSWYLYNWLQLNKDEFERQAVGSTIKTIGLPYFKKLRIAVPPFDEQKKIAQILSAWDKAISVTENLLANSQQQKKALMQQLLTGKKRLLDENGVRFSGEWRSGPLGSLVGRIYGGGTPSRANSELWGGDIPWVTVKDLISPRINGAQEYINEIGLAESASNLVLAGTVIIATRMAVGKTVMASCDVAINQDLKAICASEYVCSEYIFNWFLLHSEQIAKMGTGSTVKGVQVEAIKALNMTIPKAVEEQQKIATVLFAADAEISTLEKKLACLKDEKKALMQQLLTGKRRVSVPVKVDEKEAVRA
ncbi:restriction endonuclease subunit S [Citrobacter freundii]|uniref:restriction endonuclease subunit S n=1 Tax=Citrobacter freundii TaxID=546 RepID=UPI0024338774|nr:restriction endonuclease subunit S [Citrobacter freundii]WFV10513.1 restriction endonuclease subunit S [Citrobacter freundii]